MRDVYDDMTVLVTGANRGLGAAFVDALVELGAKKVYAAARDTEVTAMHAAIIDTEVMGALPNSKLDPRARSALAIIASGAHEVLADDIS
ncbi:SDR family NAD(P)-dependent oxidoreductase [Leifsonia aquatica]|uniref:SDR family NAD(P)-dependent oxidoreductase n=1 Tax=Leifsonia aquatica TaxID=144185 RepID=UPI000469051E